MISTVTPAEWDRPSPCEGWNTRTLVHHMIGVCASWVGGLRRATAESTPEPLDLGAGAAAIVYGRADASMGAGAHLGIADAELSEAYRRATAAVLAAWEAPGGLERTVYLSFTEMPGPLALQILTADQLIHTWDLARALGRQFQMDDATASAVLAMMQQFHDPAQRGLGKAFGHAVPWPESAPVQERLVALAGRQP